MSWRKLFIVTCALTLMACASSPQRSTVPTPIQASLRQPCQIPGPPTDGTGAAMLRWSKTMALALRECADRHNKLVQALEE